jgi:hypothetical protein
LHPVGNHILQFNTLYLTRFRTYKIAKSKHLPPSPFTGNFFRFLDFALVSIQLISQWLRLSHVRHCPYRPVPKSQYRQEYYYSIPAPIPLSTIVPVSVPSSGLGPTPPHTTSPPSECVPPPRNQRGGGDTRLRVSGLGWSKFGRLEKKPSTLPTLCPFQIIFLSDFFTAAPNFV